MVTAMSTLEKIKTDAGKLPAAERYELARWIEETEDVREMQRAALIRDLQEGIDAADRGELLEADEVFSSLRAAIPS